MPFFEKGDVRLHYEEAGSGFPLLLIPGGGLNSTIGFWTKGAPFNAFDEFKGEYRVITMDLRNANGGESTGPVEVDRPWDSHADDQLDLMEHLGAHEFMVLGCCIGGPMILKLMERAPDRVVAGVLCQPSGFRPEMPDLFYENNIKGWGPGLCERRPEITMETIDAFLNSMYTTRKGFVFSVERDFVRSCQTPMLVMPDDVSAHPYAMAMEVVNLAPKSEVTSFPWKEPKELIPPAVAHARRFLAAHTPVSAARLAR